VGSPSVKRFSTKPTLTPLASAIRTSLVGLGIGLMSSPSQAALITVDSHLDNGTDCTLRDAIISINQGSEEPGCVDSGYGFNAGFGSYDTIIFDPITDGSSVLLNSALSVNNDVSIFGPRGTTDRITLNGRDNNQLFLVADEIALSVVNLTLSGGRSTGGGGAIQGGFNSNISIDNSTLENNTASVFGGAIFNQGSIFVSTSTLNNNSAGFDGGAIYNNYADSLEATTTQVFYSTISNNRAGTASTNQEGGGIWSRGGSVRVINSTLSGNSASTTGGAIFMAALNPGELFLQNTTISNNTAGNGSTSVAGAGIYLAGQSQLTLSNAIIANSVYGTDCFIATGANTNPDSASIIGNGNCGAQRSDDPILGPLGPSNRNPYYTGYDPIQVHRLLPGSPAINSGVGDCADFSQRLYQRNDGGCDVGAVEFRPDQITVTTNQDDLLGNEVAGCSLREAVETLNQSASSYADCDFNEIDGGVPRISFSPNQPIGGDTINLNGAQIDIDANMEIDASLVSGVTVDAGGQSRVFEIQGSNVSMSNLTVTNGRIFGTGDSYLNSGGGIYTRGSNLSIINSTISNNISEDGFGGGGVYSRGGTLILDGTTVSGNTAVNGNGGGLYKGEGEAIVTNSTISTNSSFHTSPDETRNSGGVHATYGNPIVMLYNSTIANNTAEGTHAGIISSSLILSNSIIADSVDGADCNFESYFSTDPNSIVADGTCDIVNQGGRAGDPRLENLANNGGPTRTHAIASNSIARDTGENDDCPATDQRGRPRDDGSCDVGAVEFGPGDGGGFNVIPLGDGRVVVVPL